MKTTYSVADFLEYQRQGTLDLRPFYQRRSVWNARLKSQLIDSLVRSYPIPLIFLHSSLDVKSSRTVRSVVDGQQRLRTILGFVDPTCLRDLSDDDRFTINRIHNRELAGMRFADLPDETKAQILETQLSVNLLPADVQDVTVLRMFQRLNSTGVKLSAQELRNAEYSGWFKTISYDLAYEQLQRWLEWGLFRKEQISQMLEVELTSDILGYLIRGVDAGSRTAIDSLYRRYEDSTQEEDLAVLGDRFRSICDRLDEAFGGRHPKSALKEFRTRPWLYAIAAFIDEGLGDADLFEALSDAHDRLLATRKLDAELDKVLRGATSHKSSRLNRIAFLRESVTGN